MHTAFTGELLTVLGDGVPRGPELLTHDHEVRAVAFSPDGRLLATGDGGWQASGRDGPGTVHVWQLKET